MRERAERAILGQDQDELLSTGEAAMVLGTSRQHVVDLCNDGLLPYTTVGTHRRIRFADLDNAMSRTRRLSRDQRRSLWLALAVAGEIVRSPTPVLNAARQTVQDLLSRNPRGQTRRWLQEWDTLLAGPVDEILLALTSTSVRSRELRQNNPFAAALGPDVRAQVLASFRSDQASR